ncbi:hypothetical protein BB558_007567 [Smittium angustum]|uniref:Dynamin GTPase n=1 Tax=Smittium angustum TaxID=133377 RepID=A0A2U1IUR2_SMIAN|nr:hypothetical protein BB558_007567 [Smittium angustum]
MDELIPTVNKLQDVFNTLGQDQIDLPQIVVVGSQSSGKTSVLENLVGIDFLPRGNGIVTRRPLVLQLINTPESSSQNNLDSTDPEAPIEYAQFLHYPNRRFTNMNDIKREIEKETERLAGNNKGIVRKPIHLKLYSSRVLNLTMVDLPGITKIPVGDQPTDIDIQIKSLVMEYISKPNSIILAISPANVDLANSESLKIAREVDPENKRTLGVLTKIDLMDKGTSAVEILTGRVYPLRLGFIGTVCRSQEDTDKGKPISESIKDETKFFKTHPLYRTIKQNCGTSNLAKTMNTILVNHIKDRLPEIKTKINNLISNTEQELSSFGIIENNKNKETNLARLLKIITQFSSKFSGSIEGTLSDMPTNELSGGARIYHIFHHVYAAGLENINPIINLSNEEIRTAIRNSSGPRASLFVPELAFQILIKPLIKTLEPPSQRCVQLAYEELMQIGVSCETNELKRYPKLHQRVMSVVSNLLRECVQPTSSYVESIIAIERAYINTNHPDFIGGAGALVELQKKSERKRREATKIMLKESMNQADQDYSGRSAYSDEGDYNSQNIVENNYSNTYMNGENNSYEDSKNNIFDNDAGIDNNEQLLRDVNDSESFKTNGSVASARYQKLKKAQQTNENDGMSGDVVTNGNESGHFFKSFFGNSGKRQSKEESEGVLGGSRYLNNMNYNQHARRGHHNQNSYLSEDVGTGHRNRGGLDNIAVSNGGLGMRIPISSFSANGAYDSSEIEDGLSAVNLRGNSKSINENKALQVTQKLNEPLSTQERDELEIMLIRLLMSSYFQIVRKTVMDLVPKAVMHLLVNETCENLQNRLVKELYSDKIADELMQQDPELINSYNQCKAMVDIYKRAFNIISEII